MGRQRSFGSGQFSGSDSFGAVMGAVPVGVEAGAGGVGVDVVGGLHLGPTVRDPVRGAGAQLVAAGKLDRDLIVGHADRAHPRPQLVLLRPLARPTHAASPPGLSPDRRRPAMSGTCRPSPE